MVSDGGMPMQRDGTTRMRVTHAPGADVLPAFSADGRRMIWTSKRGPENTSQVWIADFTLPTAFAPVVAAPAAAEAAAPKDGTPSRRAAP